MWSLLASGRGPLGQQLSHQPELVRNAGSWGPDLLTLKLCGWPQNSTLTRDSDARPGVMPLPRRPPGSRRLPAASGKRRTESTSCLLPSLCPLPLAGSSRDDVSRCRAPVTVNRPACSGVGGALAASAQEAPCPGSSRRAQGLRGQAGAEPDLRASGWSSCSHTCPHGQGGGRGLPSGTARLPRPAGRGAGGRNGLGGGSGLMTASGFRTLCFFSWEWLCLLQLFSQDPGVRPPALW